MLKNNDQISVSDITPKDAWEILSKEPLAVMVDVRTTAEWNFVGTPDLTGVGKEVVLLSWKNYPTMQVNEAFVETLAKHVPGKNTPIVFLCKTGGRSYDAAVAMSNAGYTRCYNIADGFEGGMDSEGHRGEISGWKASRLPWRQQ